MRRNLMQKMYGAYNEKRLRRMHADDLLELCKIKPGVAFYVLENLPSLFGGFDPNMLYTARQMNNHQKIRFYKGYYLNELRNINDDLREIIDRRFIHRIHPTYLDDNHSSKNKKCNIM